MVSCDVGFGILIFHKIFDEANSQLSLYLIDIPRFKQTKLDLLSANPTVRKKNKGSAKRCSFYMGLNYDI